MTRSNPYDIQATQKALCGMYKNVTMSKDSIKTLIPHVKDQEFVESLHNQVEEYENYSEKIEDLADKLSVDVKGASEVLRSMARMGIEMKTATDQSATNVAKIMLNGTLMGIEDMYVLIRHTENLHQDVITLARQLCDFEERRFDNLKQHL